MEQLEADEKKLESSLKGKTAFCYRNHQPDGEAAERGDHKSYDAELGKVQDRLKKVRAKREKSEKPGCQRADRGRYQGACAGRIKELADQMKTLFKANHVPGFCRGSYYYAPLFYENI